MTARKSVTPEGFIEPGAMDARALTEYWRPRSGAGDAPQPFVPRWGPSTEGANSAADDDADQGTSADLALSILMKIAGDHLMRPSYRVMARRFIKRLDGARMPHRTA